MRPYIRAVTLVLLVWGTAHAAPFPADSSQAAASGSSLLAYPYAFFTPETGVAIGVGGVYSFYNDEKGSGRPSAIKTALTFTQKNQVLLVLWPELYFGNGRYFLEMLFNYFKFPDRFYGLGNHSGYQNRIYENYTPQIYRAFFNLQMKVAGQFYLGVKYQLEAQKILSFEDPQGHPPQQLAAGNLPGRESYQVSGAGIILKYDNRDNINYPAKGNYSQFSMVNFGRILGSDYRFSAYTLDIRQYLSLKEGHILAFQTFVEDRRGRLPFQSLATMGGQWIMRGYYFGRYRDKSMAVITGEYRLPLKGRLRVHVFGGTGAVGPKLDRLSVENLRTSFGIGFRYLYNAQEKIHIRMDIAFIGGEFGPYLNVVEAY